MPVRALIADDHPMCREIARMALVAAAGEVEPFHAATLEEALAIEEGVDLVILDLWLPDSRGLASLIEVAKHRPDTPILIVSARDDPSDTQHLAAAGEAGFVSKAAPITTIVEAIKAVIAGEFYFDIESMPELPPPAQRLASLTSAEHRVLRAMRDGEMNKQIAFELGLSEITVKQHVKAILRKLGALNRTQAVLLLHDVDRQKNA